MIPVAKPYLGEDEKNALSKVIDSGWVTQGPKVREFEEIFAEYTGSGYAIATTSCTTALHASLLVSSIGPGDEVIVPSLSFIATANAVLHSGATPVFVDIDPETCNMAPWKIEEAITEKTKAVMPAHQMGLPAEMDEINAVAQGQGLTVIEDAACALGSEYRGKRVGGEGNLTCFSFHPRKIITTGEGGMITTNSSEIAGKLRRLRHHGMSLSDLDRHKSGKVMIETYDETGYNYRMSDVHAAIGIEQMKKLPEIIEKRRKIAFQYNEAFQKIKCLRIPNVPPHIFHNYQSYWIEMLDDSPLGSIEVMQRLLEKGVSTRRGIMAIHKEACYSGYNNHLPETERIANHTILLPIFFSMTNDEVQYVIDGINALFSY